MTLPASSATSSTPAAAALWKPVLLRAGAALVFGAVTVFWGSPSVHVLAWAAGLYLLATAGAAFLATSVPAAAAAVVGLAGVGALITQSDTGVGVSALVGLLVLGVFELVKGFRHRGRHLLARDWSISGVVGIGTALALPFFISLGAHALLGVAGGGAIISGVLWVLSGLSLRHDGRTPSAEAVN
ncbi:conserved hypothetical protein [Arthrobacter sp. Hiyo8]|uniref:hypothetical protein n=1 Tax=unclassified Arthrobacter TaxID=235627 RepID=UPI000683920E|nr:MULTISPECIES: hypothetical protein [unclassified Arthrobacter]BAS15273.1 conserved hypothetical protein [Arthrobacter sp. Hiyo8]